MRSLADFRPSFGRVAQHQQLELDADLAQQLAPAWALGSQIDFLVARFHEWLSIGVLWPVIWMVLRNGPRSIQLFGEQHAYHTMRQGQTGNPQQHVGAFFES